MRAKEKIFTPAPEGNHVAIIIQLIDLGTQDTGFGLKPQIMLRWELCDELRDDGLPHLISRPYALSMSKNATLRGDIEAWRGRDFGRGEAGDFELQELLGTAGMLNVIHRANGDSLWANVGALAPLPKSMVAPPRQGKLVYFSLEPGEFDEKLLDELPEWIVKKILASPECKRRLAGEPEPQPKTPAPKQSLRQELNDDAPF
jgi:hypothetical protein